MSGISVLANGSSCVETGNGFQGNGCRPKSRLVAQINCLSNSSEEDMVEFRRLFDQVLACSLKEAAAKGLARPLRPVVGGDGKTLDLFELFLVVRENGGFDSVSNNGRWAIVAQELALDLKFSAFVKLIYGKYLKDIEYWLKGSREDICCRSGEVVWNQLGQEFRSLASDSGTDRLNNTCVGKDTSEKVPCSVESGDTCNILGVDDEILDDHAIVLLGQPPTKQEISSPERKVESLSGMLNWVIQIAKCPDSYSVDGIPAQAEWGNNKDQEFWIQAIRVREVLFQTSQVPSMPKQFVLQVSI